MYEKRATPPLSLNRFVARMIKHALYVILIMLISVAFGAIGFIIFEGLGLEDAVLHSTFILSGFGLISVPASTSGKMFAGIYGLYANIFFLAGFSIMFAPIIHRILHKMHADDF
ncbi:hypothetical protein [Brucella gallinifaecis]|uniref:hypothetical protein n=1 Tax=Brucella gallinifaecis TaxID=215590 RepID=UPI00235E23B4|nr:hypothetical protein [Brucella gallinifaecis]